jgi:hypothetical protein
VSMLRRGLLILLALGAWGCGGSPTAPAEDEVFYLHQRGVIDKQYSWERYFPPLDQSETGRIPRRVGVAVLDGDVMISRPIDWYIRTADYGKSQRQISYQSPRQFLFSIFERIDSPRATWAEVLERYEADLKEQGAEIIIGRIPVGTANAQGRSYLIKTRVPAKPPYDAFAHEVLVRSSRRILLVQVVHDKDVEPTVDEMTAAISSMLVY